MILQFRSIAHSLFSKILMGLLVITFGVWGIGDMLRRSDSSINIATVGDQKISLLEYKNSLAREKENLQLLLGDKFTLEIAKNFGLEKRALQKLVDSRLLAMEATALGIRTSDTDVVKELRTNPSFQDEKGNFSKDKFAAILRSVGQSEKDFINKMREQMATNLLISTLTDSITPPENAPPTLLSARNEQRSVELYTIPASVIKDLPKPSEEELKAYYGANSQSFVVPEYRKISYTAISYGDLKKEIKVSDKEIEAAYNERIDEFKKPERRKVEQLLFGNKESAQKAYDALAGGKSLEQVAKESNILNPKNTSLGLLEKGKIPTDAADQVFSLKKGEVTQPIKSDFGWHIFRVSEIVPAAAQPLAEVKSQIEKDLEQVAKEKALTELSNQLEDAVSSGTPLPEAAKELGLKVISLPAVDKNGKLENGSLEKTLSENKKLLDVAFKTDEKTESPLISGKGGVYYMLRVDSISPERVQQFEEVKQKVISGFESQEKNRKLLELANKIAGELGASSGKSAVAKSYGIPAPAELTISRTGASSGKLSAPMVMEIFSKPVGGVSEPFATGGGAYVIGIVKSINPAKIDVKDPKTSAELAEIKKQYILSLHNEVLSQYLAELARKYKISINVNAMQVQDGE